MAKQPEANATITRLLVVDGHLVEADDLIYGIFVDESAIMHYDGSLPDRRWNARLTERSALDSQIIRIGEDSLITVPIELGQYVLRMVGTEAVVNLVAVSTVVTVGRRIDNRLELRAPLQQ